MIGLKMIDTFAGSKMSKRKERLDREHGSPYDRGSADSWYGRNPRPHYYTGSSLMSERIEHDKMSEEEVKEYWRGFDDNENDLMMRKDYGR